LCLNVEASGIIPFAAAATAAVSMGVGAGLFMALPDYFAERIAQPEPSAISAIDPNLAKYNQMLADQGINAVPPMLGTRWLPVSAAINESASAGVTELEAKFAKEEEAFQADAKARRAEQIAWYSAQRALLLGPPPPTSMGDRAPDERPSTRNGEPQSDSDRFEQTDEPLTVPAT
jgi:hypothetical protein